MANKINEEHMAKMFSGFGLHSNTASTPTDNRQDTDIPTSPLSEEACRPASNSTVDQQQMQTIGRRKKSDRVSFMCRISESNLMKIRILSATSGKSLSDFIDYSITEYLKNHESEYGNILSRVQ